MNLEDVSNFMVIDPDFFLYRGAFVTKKILDFPGNFRKFDGLPAEIKKKPCWKFDPTQLEMYQGQCARRAVVWVPCCC